MIIDFALIYADGSGQLEHTLSKTANMLTARGHQVRVFQSYRPEIAEWESALPEIHYYGEKSGLEYESPDSLIEGYTNSLRHHGMPGVIVAVRAPLMNYVCRTAVAQLHGSMPRIFSWLQGAPEEYGYEEALKFSDRHLVMNEQLEEAVRRYAFQEQWLHMIGEPILLEKPDIIPRPEAKAHFISVGELSLFDNHYEQVFAAFQATQNKAALTIIGEGPDKAAIQDMAQEMEIEKSTVWKDAAEDFWQVVESATALIVNGNYEASHRLTVEALARGMVPVVEGNSETLPTLADLPAVAQGVYELPSAEDCQELAEPYHMESVMDRLETALQEESFADIPLQVIHDPQYLYYKVLDDILTCAINGSELVIQTEDEVDYLASFFTQRYINEEFDPVDIEVNRQAAYPKVESVDYHYTRASVRLLLIQTWKEQDRSEKVYCRLELINKAGTWKIDQLKREAPYRPEEQSISPTGRKKLVMVARNSSGSNTYALAKHIPEAIHESFDAELLQQQETQEYQEKVKAADVLIITEANIRHNKKLYNPNQLIIDTWHGFPLKAMGFQDKNEQNKHVLADRWGSINYVCSYSDFFSDLMIRCFKLNPEHIKLTGAPRNDLLLQRPDTLFLKEEFDIDSSESRMVFFMPTYRQVAHNDRADTNLNRDNLFGMDSFDNDQFYDFLEQENLELIVKLHPAEEKLFLNHFEMQTRVHLLTDEMLTRYGVDLYEIMPLVDMLITDYSSIYFDYLLLDKPIVYTPVDLHSYQQNRGFILDSYANWTPGPKVTTQEGLQDALASFIENPSWYGAERKQIRDRVHHYQDGKSSERVWGFIQEKIAAYTQPV
ncbi:CDP-glycerol glycerophosphotransferase, TagB/SpsB family [Terribacillus halophilus]|uniref:CDP-glycerol glycerophosphotransferase, TagB/SpsB family n=1 Tax=Terribacillus halophilus TaxID=361279 RepID=A0A1G6IZI2_9BACI|nr:CDP-glycerol glycerophosphotransferase family protein [Terribacillus halophilus]SDC11938.1 CDP-glycerol glycerophosphotransferase, TagB/SpsB family [Terribacillus halophilus]